MTAEREALIRDALAEVRETIDSGTAGPYVYDLPMDAHPNWGWLQTMWPVVATVDVVLHSDACRPPVVTDTMVNNVALFLLGPTEPYDREGLRQVLEAEAP